MKNIFEGIAWLFEELLIVPHQTLTQVELSNWWLANGVNFLFLLIGFVAMIYWINQLKIFNDRGEENKDPSHTLSYRSNPSLFGSSYSNEMFAMWHTRFWRVTKVFSKRSNGYYAPPEVITFPSFNWVPA